MTWGIHTAGLEAKSTQKMIREIAWHAEDPEVLGLATECIAVATPRFQHHFHRGLGPKL